MLFSKASDLDIFLDIEIGHLVNSATIRPFKSNLKNMDLGKTAVNLTIYGLINIWA